MTRRRKSPYNARAKARIAATFLAAMSAGLAPAPLVGAETSGAKASLRLSAGEHGAFSRVVLHGAPRGGWNVLSGERRFDLRVPGEYASIAAEAVTRHRRAHRVLALSERREDGETVLSFSLNCDCSAKPRVARSGALIIDVAPRAGAARKADENAGAIETASTPKTAPLDVDGARAFLMEQLKRAAKQGLIQYKEGDAPDQRSQSKGAQASQQNSGQPRAPEADRQAPARVSKATPKARPKPAPEGAAIEIGKVLPETNSAAQHATEKHSGQAKAAVDTAPEGASKKAPNVSEKTAPKNASDYPQAPAKGLADGADKKTYDKESLKSFFSKKRGAPSSDEPKAKTADGPARPSSRSYGKAAADRSPKHADAYDKKARASHGDAKAAQKYASGAKHSDPGAQTAGHDAAGHKAASHEAAGHDHPAKEAEKAAPLVVVAPCPAEHLLDVRNWPYRTNYFEALSERRSAIFDALNRVDAKAVAQMQLLYLAHGFGHEAAAAPKGFNVEDDDVALLAALGDVIARRAPQPGSPFNRPEPCPGLQAFWQAVALADTEPKRSLEAYRRSQRALWRTPTALRRMTGERIALAATRIGELQAAAEILAVLERSQLPPTPALRVVRAELALADGRTVAAQRELEEVAHSRDENNLLAALKLAESFSRPYEAERALDFADLLADFAMQRRGGEDMVKAITAEARLRARFGHLPDALTAIGVSQRYGGYGEDALEALRVELLDEAIASLGQDSKGYGPSAGGAGKNYVTGDAKPPRGMAQKRRSAKLDKKALALTSQLVEEISELPPGEENDRLRTELAKQISALGAPHLAPLVINDALAARSDRAATARRKAAEAAALIDPLGAVSPGADALSHDEGQVSSALDSLIAELESAESKALDQATTADQKPKQTEEEAKAAASLAKLRAAKGSAPKPAETIEDGQSLLQGVKDDLDLLRELTKKQKSTPAPETAPHASGAGKGGSKAKGDVDG